MGIPDNPLLLLSLLLPFVVAGGLPSFMNEYDYKQCDDQSCWPTTFHIELWETDVKVPNTKIIAKKDDWDYVGVTLTSLLEECSPSLAPSQLAYSFTDCKDMKHDIEEVCEYVKKGWLDDQGKIAAAFLETTFGGLEHASGYIGECLAWDGEGSDYYDYDYDYYDYDYDYLEESDADDKRVKRDTSITLAETALRTGRIEREAERKSRGLNVVRTKEGRKGGRNRHRNGRKNQRNTGNNKSQNKEDKKKKSGNKKHKNMKKNKKHHENGKNRKRKGGKRDSKNKGNKKAAQAEKKKEQEKKKALKKIGLKSLPTESVTAQLWCIERAVERALEKCGEKHLRGVDLNNATIV